MEQPVNIAPIDGCVVDWDRKIQTNPDTGERFDFDGNKLPDPGTAETVADSKPKAKRKTP